MPCGQDTNAACTALAEPTCITAAVHQSAVRVCVHVHVLVHSGHVHPMLTRPTPQHLCMHPAGAHTASKPHPPEARTHAQPPGCQHTQLLQEGACDIGRDGRCCMLPCLLPLLLLLLDQPCTSWPAAQRHSPTGRQLCLHSHSSCWGVLHSRGRTQLLHQPLPYVVGSC